MLDNLTTTAQATQATTQPATRPAPKPKRITKAMQKLDEMSKQQQLGWALLEEMESW